MRALTPLFLVLLLAACSASRLGVPADAGSSQAPENSVDSAAPPQAVDAFRPPNNSVDTAAPPAVDAFRPPNNSIDSAAPPQVVDAFRPPNNSVDTAAPPAVDAADLAHGNSMDAGAEVSSNAPDMRDEVPVMAVGRVSFAGIWSGDVDLVAPGFYGPPIDRLVVAFTNGRLSSFAFDKFGQREVFGETSAEFPLQGSRVAKSGSIGGDSYTVTVLESTWNGTSFSIRYRVVSAGVTDFEESLKGTVEGDQLRIEYAVNGKEQRSAINAYASGVLVRNDASSSITRQTTPGKWAGDINVVSPGFAGAPIDRLVVVMNEDNELAYFQFDTGLWGHQFGTAPGSFPLHGTALVTGGTSIQSYVSQVEESTFTPAAFSFRHHVVGSGKDTPATDYVETITGAIVNGRLDITYTMKGTILVAPIDKKAWGTLTAEP